MSESDLAAAMLDLQERGAHNINLVTPTHYAPSIIAAVREARAARLSIPIVYNTAAYESEYTIDMLKDVVDIWLPDLKYYSAATAKSYSFAEDLPKISRRNIERMYSYSGAPLIDDNGIMRRGVVVRVLLLPGHVAEAKLNLKYLHNTFGDNIYVSIMSQYTPQKGLQPPLCRRVTADEYGELVDYAISLGIKKAFTQEYSSANESFIPDFDME